MERKTKAVCAALLGAYLFLPLLTPVCGLCGLSVTYRYGFVFFAVLLAATAAAALLLRWSDNAGERSGSGLLAPLPLLCLIDWFLLLANDDIKQRGSGDSGLLPMLDLALLGLMLLCFALCVYLRYKHCGRGRVKALSLVLPLTAVFFISIIMLPVSLLGNIGESTVIETVASPDGKRYAELIDDDQGALGGSTVVNAYRTGELDLGIIRFTHKRKNVYWGDWGEFYDMRIEWKDNDTLLINGREYPVN